MYLMGFANPGVRPTGNLELVELSLGNKYHPPEVRKALNSNGKYCVTATTAMESQLQKSNSNKSSSSNGASSPLKRKSVRRTSLEDLPADVYMEPLSPVLLRSPTERWVPSEDETPVNWLQEDLASGQLAQEWWSFCIGKPKNDLQGKKRKTFTSTFESVFADGGISIRVEHHPLESSSSSSSEDEFLDARDSEQIGSGDEGYAQLLQHLESIEKAKVSLQQQQQQGDIGDEPEDLRGVPIPSPKPTVPSAFSPSLSSPILEMMEAYSWSKSAISNELSSEMPTPRGAEDVKKTCKHSPTNVDALLNLKSFDLYSKRRGGTQTSIPKVVEVHEVHAGEAVESQQDYPSPSSCTCGISSTSLFSDDEDPFPLSVSNKDKNMFHAFDKQFCSELANPHEGQRNGSRKSPRSVLSQEPDENSHGTSDSSETATKRHPRKQQVFNYLYNDESSDLDSPMQSGFKYELPFPAFIYEASMDMGATTSDESSDEEEDVVAGSLQALGIFQEANQREPWLVNDGGVLDDSEDLEFLLSPTILHSSPFRNGLPSLIQTFASQEMPETADGRIKHGTPKTDRESPKTDRESPKTKHESPKTHHESPKTHHESPKTHHESPKTHHESPKTHHESPKTHHESPKTHHESPKTHHESPKTHHESPKTHHESPKTHHESPKTHHESPKTHHESPKTHHESPKSKGETLKTIYESANTKHESPKTKDETLKTKYDRTKVNREGLKTKPESPKIKCESPKTTAENLKTKYEGPSTEHDSMRRPISDNKWVPYVTSRLYDDSSPRSQRNPIKRPQNPNFNNSAHNGGKTSITKGEFDKAPKRSVNFAVDLVKEIPYTSPPTSNLKQNPIAPPTKKPWELEEGGPSIMTSHRIRWQKNRENVVVDDSKSKTTPSPGGSTRWSNWTKGRVAHAVPSCTGKLLSWPKKLAFKVSNSKRWNVPDSDEDSFVGDGSFGVSARRDAELVRRILKGSQKRCSNLNEIDIMKGDFR